MLALPPHTLTTDPAVRSCPFELSDTANCGSTKIFARGYCEKHYRSLKRAGAFDLDTKPRTPEAIRERNVAAVKRARRKMLRAAPSFVDHLVKASDIASKKGDSGPAQWAILHTRTLEPVSSKPSDNTGGGTTINIGVKVSGVKEV